MIPIKEYKNTIIDYFSDKSFFYLKENKKVKKRKLNFLQICLRNRFGFFRETHSQHFLNACYSFTLLDDACNEREKILVAVKTVISRVFDKELRQRWDANCNHTDFTLYEAPLEIKNPYKNECFTKKMINFITALLFKKGLTTRLSIGYLQPNRFGHFEQDLNFSSKYFRFQCRLERKLNLLGSIIEKLHKIFRKLLFINRRCDSIPDYALVDKISYIVDRINENNIEIQLHPLNAWSDYEETHSLKFDNGMTWSKMHVNAIAQALKTRLEDNVNISLKRYNRESDFPKQNLLKLLRRMHDAAWRGHFVEEAVPDYSRVATVDRYIYYRFEKELKCSCPITLAISGYQLEFALGLDTKIPSSIVKKAI